MRFYTIAKALFIIKQKKIIIKKFAQLLLYKELKKFVIYRLALKALEVIIYLLKIAQIIDNNLI